MSAKLLSFPAGRVVGAGTKMSAAKVLSGARKVGLDECVVLGYGQDGEIYAASTEGPGDTLWLMEQAKAWLLRGGED
jgi:hypothetical protein